MHKHFVTFLCPGTLFSEDITKEIESWDIDKAIEISKDIMARHSSKPYGFYFSTKARNEDDLDSKVTSKSGMHYLGGEIFTLDQIKAKNDPSDKILISNMECNHWDRVIENRNSWKITLPFTDKDTLIEVKNHNEHSAP